MFLRTCILDDESLAISALKVDIERHCPQVKIQATFNSPTEALIYLKNNDIDLLFLDIEMPIMNGIQFLEALGHFNFDVIFTTAYQEYALQAIKLKAKDYLLKPIDADELKNAIDNLIKTYPTELKIPSKKPTKIALPDASGIEFVELDSIIYCLADKNYTTFFMLNNEKKVVSKNLGEFEKILDDSKFIRIHQSSIININFVKKITKGENASVIMKNGTELSVSRAKKNDFMELLEQFLQN